jgi:hypothetical protein
MEVDHAEDADADADAEETSQLDDADGDADAEETSQLDDADADDVEEEEDADADAEEGIELEEFEYKGETYYKDPENLVYKMDADGDLDDQPIGIWNEEKKKVLKYSKA